MGATVAAWYSGSVTHSPRDKLTIVGVEPSECTSCLDDVWQDGYLSTAGAAASGPQASKPRGSGTCQLDGGRRTHCERDQLLAYMRRVQRDLGLTVREGERVLSVASRSGPQASKASNDRFVIRTAPSSHPDGAAGPSTAGGNRTHNRTHCARMVVLACGEASFDAPLRLPPGSHRWVTRKLGEPSQYYGKAAIVVGTGRTGLESAVRLLNYGARHVTLVSRRPNPFGTRSRLWRNPYMNQSLLRIFRFREQSRLDLRLKSHLVSANGTHAVLELVVGSRRQLTVAAEVVIAAIGFTTDVDLIRSIGFRNGRLSPAGETHIRGLYNLAVSHVAPWLSSRSVLGTNIEDSISNVEHMCEAIARQSVAASSSTAATHTHSSRDVPLSPPGLITHTANNLTRRQPSAPINCSALVAQPYDVAPIRSPQAVHTFLAAHFQGRRIFEIGARNGDGSTYPDSRLPFAPLPESLLLWLTTPCLFDSRFCSRLLCARFGPCCGRGARPQVLQGAPQTCCHRGQQQQRRRRNTPLIRGLMQALRAGVG
jgi:hypothetical protein